MSSTLDFAGGEAPPPAAEFRALDWEAPGFGLARLDLPLGEVHLWLLSLDPPDPPGEAAEALLDPAELERMRRFAFARLRRRFVAAHAQMRAVLGAYAGADSRALRFSQEAFGKPRLAGAAPAGGWPAFNLSHSEDSALLAVTRGRAVGADIERIRPMDDLDGMARATMAPGELAAFAALPAHRRLEGFFACWTRKEAILKLDGRGLSLELQAFDVSLDPDAPAALLRAPAADWAEAGAELLDVPAPPGFRASVAISPLGNRVRRFILA